MDFKKLSNAELIKTFEMLLNGEVTPENAILLKAVKDEIETRKEIKIGKVENGMLDFLSGRKKWSVISKQRTDPAVEVGLVILDKESTGIEGFRRYDLGYALDTMKPFEGDNLIKAMSVIIPDTNYKTDSVIAVKVASIKPVKEGKLYKVELSNAISFEEKKCKLNSGKEIIRKAFDAGLLNLEKGLAVDLCKCGILKMDIDEHFGIGLNKDWKIHKADNFLKEGIVYGVVYPVNELDTDNDYATPEEVQKACWRFMEDFQKFNYMHEGELSGRDVSLVECACALTDASEYGIKKGDWYIAVKVYNDALKKQIESGEITGFSMEGSAQPGKPIPMLEAQKQ